MVKKYDLINKRFALLKVLSIDSEKANEYFVRTGKHKKYWKCICDCGNTTSVSTSDLNAGETKSCGCLMTRTGTTVENLINNTYGRLKVIELDVNRMKEYKENHSRSRTYWLCKCECGETISVDKNKLTSGHTKSCGCLQIDSINTLYINKAINGYSFYDWCIDNKKEEWIKRWDYQLNTITPQEVLSNSGKKYWFICPKGIHKSESRVIGSIVTNQSNDCNMCNSFGQYLLDEYGVDGIKKYWSDKNKIDAFQVAKSSQFKAWFKCVNKDYHQDYKANISSFFNNSRCPYCKNKKIHPLDSVGTLFPKILDIWSDKNNKTPYQYSPSSGKKIWVKCLNGLHEEELRTVDSVRIGNFSCSKCSQLRTESLHASVLKQVFLKIKKETVLECRDCINPNTGYALPTDIVNHIDKMAIEIQSSYHDSEEQKIKDVMKKEYWVSRGYDFYAPDMRNYTILEMIQIFFPHINKIPTWIKYDFNDRLDVNEVQSLLNIGYFIKEIAEIMEIKPSRIHGAVHSKRVILPEGYWQKVKNIKKIIQIDLLGNFIKEWNSFQEISDVLGISHSVISNSVNGKYATHEHFWVFKHDYDINNYVLPDLKGVRNRPIVRLNLNGDLLGEYISQTDAGKQTDISQSYIGKCLKTKGLECIDGTIWLYKHDFLNDDYVLTPAKPSKHLPFYQIDKTGKILNKFDKQYHAVKKNKDVHTSSLAIALNSKRKYGNGYFWVYVHEYESFKLPDKIKEQVVRTVVVLNDNFEYITTLNSKQQVCKFCNMSIATVNKILNGDKDSFKGFILKYKEDYLDTVG